MCGLGLDARIRRLAERALVKIPQDGFKPCLVLLPEQSAGFAARDQVPLEHLNAGMGLGNAGQHTAGGSFRLGQQPFVVALQKQKGPGIAGDDIDQAAVLVAGERLASGGLADEHERCLQFPRLLLETPTMDSVTLREMLFEDLGGPDAELGTAFRLDAVADGDDHIQAVKGDRLVGICNVHFLHIAIFLEFTFRKDVPNMFGEDRSPPASRTSKAVRPSSVRYRSTSP